ncbi:hypothetical protein ACC735_38285, partial [Rhizobium ruizarguesonis]
RAGQTLLFGIVLIQSTGAVTTGKPKSGTQGRSAMKPIDHIRFDATFCYSLFNHGRTQKIGFPSAICKA